MAEWEHTFALPDPVSKARWALQDYLQALKTGRQIIDYTLETDKIDPTWARVRVEFWSFQSPVDLIERIREDTDRIFLSFVGSLPEPKSWWGRLREKIVG